MESSRVCNICGTVNPESRTNCLACGQVLSAVDIDEALASAPTVFLPPNKLLKQRYRVLHVAGKGGMGTVYIGRDIQLGNRLVAIKEMGQSGLSPSERIEAARNFKREAHLLAGLQHPNLPSIYDHFEEEQRWYLVMSFVKGQTLTQYLRTKNGQLPIEEVLEIGIVLCTVLHYLHTNRPPIIFRDLKPSNIMRTVDGHIYLIDFGIARLFKPGQTKDTANHGTSGYASPEQYGTAQTTPRSDIYSLGATLYQLLSGYEPANTPFLLPPLQWHVPDAPVALVTLITQMLDLDEQRRPQSVDVVKRELQRISSGLNSTFLLTPPAQTPGVALASSALTPTQLRDLNSTPQSPVTPAHLSDFDLIPPPLTPVNLPGVVATPRSLLSMKKKKRWVITSGLVTGIVVVSIAIYLILSNVNAFNANTPYGVVNTFCHAMDSQTPDFQTAYEQFSRNYQSTHTLVDFQEAFQGTIQCFIASAPNKNNQAGLNIAISCPHGPPPVDRPPPPIQGAPPPSRNPVNLTLINEGSNGWKIDTIYLVGPICGLLPGQTPPPGPPPR